MANLNRKLISNCLIKLLEFKHSTFRVQVFNFLGDTTMPFAIIILQSLIIHLLRANFSYQIGVIGSFVFKKVMKFIKQ